MNFILFYGNKFIFIKIQNTMHNREKTSKYHLDDKFISWDSLNRLYHQI